MTRTHMQAPRQAFRTDDQAETLEFLVSAFEAGMGVALGILTEIRGGAAKRLGTHMVITEDGQYCGYVSGGCVEAAVAYEAVQAIAEQRDRVVAFGTGSPFMDIALPCGGGISVTIHCVRDVDAIIEVLSQLAIRRPASLSYDPQLQRMSESQPLSLSRWLGPTFHISYRPTTRIVLSGASIEADRIEAVAISCGYDVIRPDRESDIFDQAVDYATAVVLLHHDLDNELPLLRKALLSDAFYIGALGSVRTHRERTDRLAKLGFAQHDIDRIRGPIGLFGPARDASALAISILGQIVSETPADQVFPSQVPPFGGRRLTHATEPREWIGHTQQR